MRVNFNDSLTVAITYRWTVEEAGIKPAISPQIRLCITLQNLINCASFHAYAVTVCNCPQMYSWGIREFVASPRKNPPPKKVSGYVPAQKRCDLGRNYGRNDCLFYWRPLPNSQCFMCHSSPECVFWDQNFRLRHFAFERALLSA